MSLKVYYERHGNRWVECYDVYATETGQERIFNNMSTLTSEILLDLLKLHKKINVDDFLQNIKRSGYSDELIIKRLLIILKRSGQIKEENGVLMV